MRILTFTLSFLAMLASTVAMAGEASVTLAVENMTCATCPITVKAAIKAVPGVKDVKVDFEKKVAVVVYDDALATVDKLAGASRDAGYPAMRKE